MKKSLRFIVVLVGACIIAGSAHAGVPGISYADLAEKLIPAVVNISTTQEMKMDEEMGERTEPFRRFPPGHPMEEFNDFLDRFYGPRGNNGATPMNRKMYSLGSGFVIDPDGYIVTNYHVVRNADEIIVSTNEGTKLKAKIIGSDAKTDLALLKVEAGRKLAYVRFGDSDRSRVGDPVVAIGNPFGLGGTVTAGIISARARDINAGPFDDFIQTDAAINRGSSGGPMFNMNGEVIGINTAIFSPTGGNIGIGFALPSNLGQPIIQQLRERGKIRRSWLGVKIQTVNAEIKESLGLPEEKGALVVEVTKDSPARRTGIQSGDVILKFDGKEINEMRRLPRIVAETPIGKTAPVEIWRKGVRKTVEVQLTEVSEKEPERAKPYTKSQKKGQDEAEREVLGLRLAPLSDQLRSEYEIPPEVRSGLLVLEVDPRSSAAERGIMPGDIVLEANQKPATKVQELEAGIQEARNAGRKSVLLLINRGGESVFIAVPVE